MSRQPKPGEWWFSPDGKERAFYAGVDGDGDPLWEFGCREFTVRIPPSYVPVPDCTGWEWEFPAMPIGWELCGPPTDAVECTFTRVWEEEYWYACRSDYINASAYTYCRRPKSADPEPQYRPFANAEEFWPFRNCWWRNKDSPESRPSCPFTEDRYGDWSWQACFEKMELLEDIDGKMVARPFGLEVSDEIDD
jgi:hypothetical protein